MPQKNIPIEGAVTPAEALKFAAVAEEVITSPKYRPAGRRTRTAAENTPHIGTLREKRLHAAIKLYLCPDESCHERPAAELCSFAILNTPSSPVLSACGPPQISREKSPIE